MAALSGVRVLDVTRLLPGPFGTMMLADQGAEVIKIEEPGRGDPLRELRGVLGGMDELFAIINRGKRSITLNLRHEAGQALLHKLLARADVLVEGFRPDVMQGWGLDYGSLANRYPRLVYCSISGFGQCGPKKHVPGHDLNYLGWAGLLATFDGGASLPPTLLADLQAGLCAALGIVLALQGRAATGKGRFVDVDMTRSLAPFLLPGIGTSDSGGPDSRRADASDHRPTQAAQRELRPPLPRPWYCGGLACYNVYRTADGKLVTLAALEAKFWREFCVVVGRPDLADEHLDPERQAMLHDEVARIIAGNTQEYWLEVAKRHDVCLGPVRSQAEALADGSLRDPSWPGPFASPLTATPAPELGADTRRILIDELGCDPGEVARAGGDVRL
jgi:crotonobetainyl-CoA:carnitine CoA-transferase CaiB-like acyl-CoA transferase